MGWPTIPRRPTATHRSPPSSTSPAPGPRRPCAAERKQRHNGACWGVPLRGYAFLGRCSETWRVRARSATPDQPSMTERGRGQSNNAVVSESNLNEVEAVWVAVPGIPAGRLGDGVKGRRPAQEWQDPPGQANRSCCAISSALTRVWLARSGSPWSQASMAARTSDSSSSGSRC